MAFRPLPSEPVFKRLRIAILLYILLFVALGQWLASWRSRDWNDPLYVGIWLVNGDGSATTDSYLDSLDTGAYQPVESFFTDEARAYGLELERPFRVWLAGRLETPPPAPPADGGGIGVLAWSLRMRWFVTRLHFSYDGPTPDITLFAIYREGGHGGTLDRSTALRKGMIVFANLYATREMHGSNQMVIAHEMLHTLGASDKYDLATGLPLHPHGLADPGRKPVFPQEAAELMAGRIALGPAEAATPHSLDQVTIGPETAYEIGWTATPPRAYAP
jgi:hypothetical protein